MQHTHNMSGGQLQRIRHRQTLALNPEVLVCDEATSDPVDVSASRRKIIGAADPASEGKTLPPVFYLHGMAGPRATSPPARLSCTLGREQYLQWRPWA